MRIARRTTGRLASRTPSTRRSKPSAAAEPRVAPRPPPPVHHVHVAVERGQEPRDVARIVLQVGVDRDDDPAARVLDAGGEGGGLAVVARQADDAEPRLARDEPDEALEAPVAAPVVDRDDLRRAAERIEHRAELGDERLQALRLVVERDDDRERGRRGAQNSVSATNCRYRCSTSSRLSARSRRPPKSSTT